MRKLIWLMLLVSGWSNAAEKNVTLSPITVQIQGGPQHLYALASTDAIKTKTDASGSSVTPPTQIQYEKVVSACKVVSQSVTPEMEHFNVISPEEPIIIDLVHLMEPNAEITGTNMTKAAAGTKATLLVKPEHGEWKDSMYYPAAGYTGMDQMTFEVEANGKKFKVIYSVWVLGSDDHPANYTGCDKNGPQDNFGSFMEIPQDGAVDADADADALAKFHALFTLINRGQSKIFYA